MAAPINYGHLSTGDAVDVTMYRTHDGRLVIEITDACDEDVEVVINGHHALANERNYGAWNGDMNN